MLGRRRCRPTVDSLQAVEAAALAGAPDGTRLEVVMEPTVPAWLPVAVFFAGRCHRVYRVPSAKAADLRRFLSRHAKSNQIDAAVVLYGVDGAMPFADLAAELATEIRLLRAVLAEQRPHQQARERAYRRVEPDELARSLPGIAQVGAPLLVAAIGRAQRFGSAAKFKALCVVAAKLAERCWTVEARGEPYVVRDVDGRPVDPEEARRIITERYTVPEEVRRRRRSTKPRAGKAPQQVPRRSLPSRRRRRAHPDA